MSYLGKISALVTVNTGDFGPKLNACARDVRTFAQVVQREIGSSMRDANKAFEGIYTPLQRFERAMRAASSAKLSFVGLPGAIRTVDELQKRLGTLNSRQVSVVLKASGMKSLDDFRASIQGLTTRNLNILAKVGGLDELKQLREQMVSGAGAGAVELDLRTGEAKAKLKSLEAELAQARQDAKGIPLTMRISDAGLAALEAEMEKLIAKKGVLEKLQIRAPLGSAKFDALGKQIDDLDQKIETLNSKHAAGQAIADVDRLAGEVEAARIEVAALQEQFERKVGKDVASGLGIRSIDDAIAALGSLGISGEAARKVIDALLKSDGDAFIGTMRQTRSAVEQIFKPLSDVQEIVASLAPEVQAGFLPALKRAQAVGESLRRTFEEQKTSVADIGRQFDAVLTRVNAVEAAAKRVNEAADMASKAKTGNELMFSAPKFAAVLGRSKDIGESAARLSSNTIAANPGVTQRLVEINSLTNKAVAAYARLQANIANKMPTDGASRRFEAALAALQALQDQAEQEIKVHVDAAEADEEAKKLKETLKGIAGVAFPNDPLGGLRSSAQKARSEVEKVKDATKRAALEARLQAAAPRIEVAEKPADQQRLAAELEKIGSDAKIVVQADIDKEKLDKQIKDLGTKWQSALSGKPQGVEDADSALTSLFGKIEKLDSGQRQRFAGAVANLLRLRAAATTSATAMTQLADEIEKVDSDATNAAGIKKLEDKLADLSKNATTQDLAAELASAKAAGVKPSDSLKRRVETASNTGRDPNDPLRQLDRSESRIKALKDQIASLDAPLRNQILPDIQRLNTEIDALANMGASATADDIENLDKKIVAAEQKAKRLNAAMNFRVKFNAGGLDQMLNAKFIKGFEAQLEILANTLTKLSGKAAGEGRAAFLKLSEAIQDALDNDQLADPQVRKSLEKITQETAKTIGALKGSGTTAGRLGQQVKRAGDIGRGGFDNLSLAVNQAAFAIDDFMSSTGGLEFKLRAVSNNITQMAFVIGGTKGLFVGLAAVIGGQVAVGLIRFANGGQAAEDRTKALNDALSKQKTTVDELARAYGELGKQLLRGTLSSGADSAMEMASSMKAAADAMRQLSREGIGTFAAASGERPGAFFSNSLFAPKNIGNEQRGVTGVLAERAQQESLRKRIEGSENPGEIAALRQQIEDSRKRERAAAGRATAQLTPDVFTIQSAVNAAAENLRFRGSGGGGFIGRNSFGLSQLLTPEGFGAGVGSIFGLSRNRPQQAFDAARGIEDAAVEQGAAGGTSMLARERQIAFLQNAIKALTPVTQQKNFFAFASGMAVEAQKATAEFQQLIELIRRDLRTGLTSAIENTTNSLQDAANEISSAQEQVAEAIRRGVPSARELQRELNSLGAELAGAYQSLAEASDMAAAGENPEGKTPKSEQGRQDAVARAQSKVDEVRARRAELENRVVRAMVAAPSGSERASAALSRVQGTAGMDVEATRASAALQGVIARETLARAGATDATSRLAALEKQLAEQDAKVAAEENGIARLRLQAERDDIESKVRAARVAADAATANEQEAATRSTATAAFAEFVTSIQEATSRIRAFGDSAIQSATRVADTLRQAAAESPTRGDLRGLSDEAERMLIDDRARVRIAQDNLATDAASIATSDPELLAIQARREELLSQQKQAAETMAADGIPEAPADAQARRQELIELDRQQEQLTFELLEARRRELQEIEAGTAARQREIEKSLARDREQPSIDRQQKQIDSAMNAAEQRVAEQQQRFIQAPTAENKKRRDEAEASLGASRRKAQELQDSLDLKRSQLEGSDPVIIAERQKLAGIAAEKAAEAKAAAEQGRSVDENKMAALDERERASRAALDARMAGQTLDERKAIDKFAMEQDVLGRNEAGRRLGLTDRERFREDMEVGIGADIRARAAVLERNQRLGKAGDDPQAFINRALSEQMKTVAPMLEEFRMERETAMLQGPSRAALQVSDVTTTQGQSELNRLLRGDDAAKDVNLAELRKQSGLFQELINVVRNNPIAVLP